MLHIQALCFDNFILHLFRFQLFNDVAIRREILSLIIKCKNSNEDCVWFGELRELEVCQCYLHSFILLYLRNMLCYLKTMLHLRKWLLSDHIFFPTEAHQSMSYGADRLSHQLWSSLSKRAVRVPSGMLSPTTSYL